tara:strand:+ start:1946 stop:2323 length:378 start_codon:yes stop_codon:yes gene_type:complete
MGYSYAIVAGDALDALFDILAGPNPASSNCWERKGVSYFFERGRENRDGAITGTVYRNLTAAEAAADPRLDPSKTYCRKAGTFRIDPDGRVTRFPSTTKAERERATEEGRARFRATRGSITFNLM